MSYANLYLSIWELGRILLGKLAHFHLGTWTDFTWEVGRISLGKLAVFPHHAFYISHKKRRSMHPRHTHLLLRLKRKSRARNWIHWLRSGRIDPTFDTQWNTLIINKLQNGNLFHLGSWLIFTWELGRILLGKLDGFCLGSWTDFH